MGFFLGFFLVVSFLEVFLLVIFSFVFLLGFILVSGMRFLGGCFF